MEADDLDEALGDGGEGSVRLTRRRTGPVSLAEAWQTPAFTAHADAKPDATRCSDAIRPLDLAADQATWGLSVGIGGGLMLAGFGLTLARAGLAAATMLCIGVWPAHAAPDGARVAFVVGNSAYVNAPQLPNPRLDANRFARNLESAGFSVILGQDLTKAAFDHKLREFAALLDDAKDAVFFYAGHGLQINGRNFIVPIDAKLEQERDVPLETTGIDVIQEQMEYARVGRTSIIILDACRNNPLARSLARSLGTRSVSVGEGLAQMRASIDTFIAFSTDPGSVAMDGAAGQDSPFTAALLKQMLIPGKPLTAVMMDVRKQVVAATDQMQVPWDHSALTQDFYFVPPRSSPGKTAEAPPQEEAPQVVPKSEFDALSARLSRLEKSLARGENASAPTSTAAVSTPPVTAATAATAARRTDCTEIAAQMRAPIALEPGKRLCQKDGPGRAIIKRVVKEAVVFVTEGFSYDTTCRPRDLCQFNWSGAPLFNVRIDYDAGSGVAKAQMIPKGQP